jgi:hypothetical protein
VNTMICTPRIEAATVKFGVAVPPGAENHRRSRTAAGPGGRDLPLTAASVLDTCVSDCAWYVSTMVSSS